MTTENLEKILDILEGLYPETHCFLHFQKDYELLFAVLLSAQATDISVNKATEVLFSTYLDLPSYAKADKEDIEKIVHSVGLSKTKSENIVKTARILLEKYDGQVPKDREKLVELPGVGFKTAGVVLAELYGYPYLPVDTHVKRVTTRLGIVKEGLTPEKIEHELERKIHRSPLIDIHRRFILLGRNICLARNPKCLTCPLLSLCQEGRKIVKVKKEVA